MLSKRLQWKIGQVSPHLLLTIITPLSASESEEI